MKHPECKYCDNPLPPATIDGDIVCSRCGAEWADAKIMVEDDTYIEELNRLIEENEHYAHLDEINRMEDEEEDYELWAYEQE